MKKYMILIPILFSINAISQVAKDSSVITKNEKIYFVFSPKTENFSYIKNYKTKLQLNYIPTNRKIDIHNSNYPKVDYDIFNPNKSIDLMSFFLSGITNLF